MQDVGGWVAASQTVFRLEGLQLQAVSAMGKRQRSYPSRGAGKDAASWVADASKQVPSGHRELDKSSLLGLGTGASEAREQYGGGGTDGVGKNGEGAEKAFCGGGDDGGSCCSTGAVCWLRHVKRSGDVPHPHPLPWLLEAFPLFLERTHLFPILLQHP